MFSGNDLLMIALILGEKVMGKKNGYGSTRAWKRRRGILLRIVFLYFVLLRILREINRTVRGYRRTDSF